MTKYQIDVYNDMGHIETHPHFTELPKDVGDFLMFECLPLMPYRLATDNKGLGCRFYVLPDGTEKSKTFKYTDITIVLKYNLDTFDPKTMRWLW
jgi:hypothetical protein